MKTLWNASLIVAGILLFAFGGSRILGGGYTQLAERLRDVAAQTILVDGGPR